MVWLTEYEPMCRWRVAERKSKVAEFGIQQNQKKYIFIDGYAVIQQYQFESFINSFKMLSTNHIEIYCNLRLAILFGQALPT